MAVTLEGHGPAAAEAEGEIDAVATLRLVLPVVETPGLLPALGHALPDIAAGKLRVTDQGDALVDSPVVVDGEGVVEIGHAVAMGKFGEGVAPLQDFLAQDKRGRMHPGLIVGAAAAGEFRVGELIVDLHDRIELNDDRPTPPPVLAGPEAVVVGRCPVDGDLDADQAQFHQLLRHCPGQQKVTPALRYEGDHPFRIIS